MMTLKGNPNNAVRQVAKESGTESFKIFAKINVVKARPATPITTSTIMGTTIAAAFQGTTCRRRYTLSAQRRESRRNLLCSVHLHPRNQLRKKPHSKSMQ